ncbi:MAG: ABC transporter permease, partial [Chlamydiales bacterium]|nr:ABC transporter permease [Chlamydiales bacterium]
MNEKSLFQPLSSQAFDKEEENSQILPASYFSDAWQLLKANHSAMFGLITLTILLLFAIFAPFFSPYTYYETQLSLKNTPPNASFWFGTDELGRDLFTRCWWGARISLFVGITASLIDLAIGVLFGALAGFIGGKTEEWMMRIA